MEEGQGRRGKKSKSAPYKEGGASLPPQTSAKPPHLAAPITPFETKESVFSKRPAMRPFFQLLFSKKRAQNERVCKVEPAKLKGVQRYPRKVERGAKLPPQS